MRTILLITVLSICGYAFAESQTIPKGVSPSAGESETGNKKNTPPDLKQEITVNHPPGNMNLSGKLDVVVQKDQVEEPSKWADPITWFTLVIAIANIMLWIKTGNLVTEAIRASGIAKESADASKIAANAAKKSAKAAQRTLEVANRPWVLVEKIEHLERFPNMETYCRVGYKVAIKNSGGSVAKSVIFDSRALKLPPSWDWLAERVEDLRIGTIKLWAAKRPDSLPVGIALAPGQMISPIRCPAFPDGNDPTDEQIAEGAFLIIGYIQYADQFGITHHTRFAFIPDADSVRPWDGKSFAIYNDYQDAD